VGILFEQKNPFILLKKHKIELPILFFNYFHSDATENRFFQTKPNKNKSR
jgi:hypothetical protein